MISLLVGHERPGEKNPSQLCGSRFHSARKLLFSGRATIICGPDAYASIRD